MDSKAIGETITVLISCKVFPLTCQNLVKVLLEKLGKYTP